MTAQHQETDVLIIGSGAAGLSLALRLAEQGMNVAVLSKGPIAEGSTLYAQGGVSAVVDRRDSTQSHCQDTLKAGAGLCDEKAVCYTVEHGKQAIDWLVNKGVPFTGKARADGSINFHLTREGGHSHRRVVHAADATGRAIETTLVDQVQQVPNITIYEYHIAVDLLSSNKILGHGQRCLGAYVLNKPKNRVDVFKSRFTVLATGGASKVYLYTSNPDGSTGDGIAMAWRAGCRVANMEFMQFHPTCLYHPKAKSFLISEALRGEGGRLILPDGSSFMQRFDERGELAPRDIVARAIDHEMKRLGVDCVFLDISHRSTDFIKKHFPTIHARCLEFGIDITKEPIPVVPAAHYTCGGIMSDLNAQTDLDNLYAIGEAAYTGLHGANRMASNSLLECLVFSQAACEHILSKREQSYPNCFIPEWDESQVVDSDEHVVVTHNWDELRRFMWDYVGIVRTTKRLERAKRRVDLLLGEINEYYSHFRVNSDLIELRNLAVVADLIIRSALSRQESRGLHYTRDYPDCNPKLDGQATVIDPPAKSKPVAPLQVVSG